MGSESDEDFDLMPVKRRGMLSAGQFSVNKPEEDFNTLPVKPEALPQCFTGEASISNCISLSKQQLDVERPSKSIFVGDMNDDSLFDCSLIAKMNNMDLCDNIGKGNDFLCESSNSNVLDMTEAEFMCKDNSNQSQDIPDSEINSSGTINILTADATAGNFDNVEKYSDFKDLSGIFRCEDTLQETTSEINTRVILDNDTPYQNGNSKFNNDGCMTLEEIPIGKPNNFGNTGDPHDTKKYKGVTFDLPLTGAAESTSASSSFINSTDSGICTRTISSLKDEKDIGNFDEMFQSVTSVSTFMEDLDFLEKCGEPDADAMERLARKSLYVRFDPLVKRDSRGPSLQSDYNSEQILNVTSDPFSPVKDNQKLACSKLLNKYDRSNEPERTEFSVLDITCNNKELEGSGLQNTFSIRSDDLDRTELVEPLLYSQSDLDEIINKHECTWQKKIENEIKVRELDWNKKYEDLESNSKEDIAIHELLVKDHQVKIETLNKRFVCLQNEYEEIKQVMCQYEKSITEITNELDKSRLSHEENLTESIKAKELLHVDLSNAEANLFDAYKRIEKLKEQIDTYKSNEEVLKRSLSACNAALQKAEERYKKLRDHCTEKIDSANIEINKVRKQKEIDLLGLQTALKKSQNKVNNLELVIQQKSLENKQLSQICDDLIKKFPGEEG